ncbi:MAG: DUF3999 family protein [Pseudomonadota bacterium]
MAPLRCLFITLMLSAVTGHAAAPSDIATDYAYSLPLTLKKDGGVAALLLPQPVYLHARSAELDDLRLFDRNGVKVPFAIQAPPARTQARISELPVRIFPLPGTESQEQLKLDIRTGSDGRLLSVSSNNGSRAKKAKTPLGSLILDLGIGRDKEAPPVTALRFDLPAGVDIYSAQLRLDSSDDLQHWNALGEAELNWAVNRDAQALSNNRVPFPATRFRYARLYWSSGTPLLFSRIVAEALDTTPSPVHLDTVLLQPDAAKTGADLVYHAPLAIPGEKIGLQFSEANVVFPTLLGTYQPYWSGQHRAVKTWIFSPKLNTTFYRMTPASGAQRDSADIDISPTHTADWVLRPQTETALRPTLRLSWAPATLLFLANGNGPYRLTFGRERAPRVALAPEQIAPGFSEDELRNVAQAQSGALSSLTPEPPPGGIAGALQSARLRKGLLWGVLVAGVAILALMATRLLRQLNAADQKR